MTTKAMTNNNTEPYKPVSMMRDEFVQGLINLANNSGLPAIIMEYVVRDFYQDIRATAAKQYEQEKQQYQDELAKQTKDESK